MIIFKFAIALSLAYQGVETMNDSEFAERCRNKLAVLMAGIDKEILTEEIISESNGSVRYVAKVKAASSSVNYTFTCMNSSRGMVVHMDLSGNS